MDHATHTPATQIAAVVDEMRVEAIAAQHEYEQADALEDQIIRRLLTGIRAFVHEPMRLLALATECERKWLLADARADRRVKGATDELVALNDEFRRLSVNLSSNKKTASALTPAV